MASRKEKIEALIDYFSEHNPEPTTELNHSNPFELLVATVLSAQCTDVRVNKTTPELFEHFPDAKSLAKASFEDVQPLISSISYPNNKTRHLINMAQMLQEDFEGQVPKSTTDLQKLPGVGRKTANVVASTIFDVPALGVDTHVFRVSKRIGLVKNAKTPLETEKQLIKYLPEDKVRHFHHWLILHGRYTCLARSPKCEKCDLTGLCDFYKKKQKKAKK